MWASDQFLQQTATKKFKIQSLARKGRKITSARDGNQKGEASNWHQTSKSNDEVRFVVTWQCMTTYSGEAVEIMNQLGFEVLGHPADSPDLTPSIISLDRSKMLYEVVVFLRIKIGTRCLSGCTTNRKPSSWREYASLWTAGRKRRVLCRKWPTCLTPAFV